MLSTIVMISVVIFAYFLLMLHHHKLHVSLLSNVCVDLDGGRGPSSDHLSMGVCSLHHKLAVSLQWCTYDQGLQQCCSSGIDRFLLSLAPVRLPIFVFTPDSAMNIGANYGLWAKHSKMLEYSLSSGSCITIP